MYAVIEFASVESAMQAVFSPAQQRIIDGTIIQIHIFQQIINQQLTLLGRKQIVFIKIRKLGFGGFGVVWLQKEISSGNLVAIKELRYYSEDEKLNVNNEIKVQKDSYEIFSQSSPSFIHIVKPYGFFLNDKGDKAFIVMEYCSGGDLNTYIKDMIRKGTEINIELHSHDIIHGDLKPQNVLLTKDFKIKLADFGLARELQEGRTSVTFRAGTNLYFAPEILNAGNQELKRLKFSADIWACGIILYELLAHKHPFDLDQTNFSQYKFMHRVINDEPSQLPAHYPENMRNLIKTMLIKNPGNRITAEQIMQVPEVIASLAKQ
ncbi:MAG: putative Serine/threonine-protein kinase Nek5 [Streblomastix strix]|uniref:non-specific serine/threonine protein kinase n=1 Tax=Streblomastix strix TaxID=222440 RepID=A0A5J4W1U5_9EUKA|nr:MAG: putative Serine/threonine-protein kinase Nek5 [Streblomastix strix]